MTENRDLKRRVRERQAQTGESYMTALRHVLDQRPLDPRPGAIPVLDFIDRTEAASALGITCEVRVLAPLGERVDVTAMLTQLRTVLLTTVHDPVFAVMRAVVLQGLQPTEEPPFSLDDGRRFRARVQAGIGGISENGRLLAFAVAGQRAVELVVFVLGLFPKTYVDRPPVLIVTSPESMIVGTASAFGWRGAL